jgi:hypothetical protein
MELGMALSSFILALWVFLTSAAQLGWFSIDGRFIGFVGIAYVVVFVLECLAVIPRVGRRP